MGCNSSKRIEAAVDVYRPPPSSFAVFDISSIQEPWLVGDNTSQENQQKVLSNVPAPILEKLNKFETDAPHSWDEVSKALEDLKPSLNTKLPNIATPPPPQQPQPPKPNNSPAADEARREKKEPKKSVSFHTLEELEAKLSPKPEKDLKRAESIRTQLKKVEVVSEAVPVTEMTGGGGAVIKPVKENIFLVKDRLERQREGKPVKKLDPLSGFEEKCPPGGADSVVIYTTSLRGVRRTFEDCTRVKMILELHHVVFDERDVSLHGEFLNELRDLVGEEASVPRVFIKGKYTGGPEEVVELNESGRLGRILIWARVERVVGRQACEGCGDAKFVPCLECGGSCKVLVDGVKERCGKCNENGLVRCPTCF